MNYAFKLMRPSTRNGVPIHPRRDVTAVAIAEN